MKIQCPYCLTIYEISTEETPGDKFQCAECKNKFFASTLDRIDSQKIYCLTGKFRIKRSEVEHMIEDHGGIIHDDIDITTNYIVIGAGLTDISDKLRKLNKYTIKTIPEEALYQLIDNSPEVYHQITQYNIQAIKQSAPCSINKRPIRPSQLPTTIVPGKAYCVTGKLVQFKSRKTLWQLIAERGGNTVDAVNERTDFLIVGDKNQQTGKIEDAIGRNIPMLTESEIKQMIENTPPSDKSGILAGRHSRIPVFQPVQRREEVTKNIDGLKINKKVSDIQPEDTAIFRFEYRYYNDRRITGNTLTINVADYAPGYMWNEEPHLEDIQSLKNTIAELQKQSEKFGIRHRIFLNTPKSEHWYQIYLGITMIMPPGTSEIAEPVFEQLCQIVPKTSDSSIEYGLFSEKERTGRYWLDRIEDFC